MPNFEFSMRIDNLTVPKNGRSNKSSVQNRILVQLVAPSSTDHPTSSFVTPTNFDGSPVPLAEIEDDLPFRLAFKAEDFKQVFGEPLKIRFHHFQDTKRDKFQVIVGKIINFAINDVLGGTRLLGVKLDKLLSITDNLELDEKTYSQKLGAVDLVLTPADFDAGQIARTITFQAPSAVKHLRFVGPNAQPQNWTVVSVGDTTAVMNVSMVLTE